jgi:EmrB/QacA subfamily drug resistance transporter
VPCQSQPTTKRASGWAALGVASLAQLLVTLDSTVINVALPSAQQDLHFGDADRQWVITAYSLAFGSLLLTGGRVSDLLGRKTALVVGLAGFAASSACGGAAGNLPTLLVSRALQGVFAALLAPAALALLSTAFPDGRGRRRAFGIYSAVLSSGAAVGLLLGGVLTQYLSWRWCMLISAVMAVPALWGVSVLPRLPRGPRPRLDAIGTVAVSCGLFALVFGLSLARTSGWGSDGVLATLVVALVLIVGFVFIERRAAQPMLPIDILTDRDRGGALVAQLLMTANMFSLFLFLTYYFQDVLGYNAVVTGLGFCPLVITATLVAWLLSAALIRRLGFRLLMPTAMLLAAAGFGLLTRLSAQAVYMADVLPALVLIGAGLSLVFASAINLATRGVEQQNAGIAGATVNVSQQIGGSIGAALLSTVAAKATADFLRGLAPSGSLSVAAAVHGYTTAFCASVALLVCGAVIAFVTLRPGAAADDPEHA